MSLVSNIFLLFIATSVLVYYLMPGKYQWLVLLFFSYVYYIAGGKKYVCFLVASTVITWLLAYLIEKKREADEDKSVRGILILGLILNFGMLGILKYTNFFVENINSLLGMNIKALPILFPLGISFYTFQSSGYLLDVYWKRCKAEKNLFRYALFVSFFPQILQGPIGRYSSLAEQLYKSHKFQLKTIVRGAERILWGFFKKMIIADWAAVFADAIFEQPEMFDGIALFGVLFYTLQLYADFSGGMDVVIGIAAMFGITLDENFKRPFFAVSITDFWHRWHITLGTWMKDYVFYPVTLSGWMGKVGKYSKKKLGRKIGRTIPICLANIIVFLVVGIWHGAAWKYIVYGMYNGLIIAFSGLMADQYRNWKKKLHITGKEAWYYLYTVARTFILVVISMYFDRADTVGQALYMLKRSILQFTPSQLLEIPAGRQGTAFTPYALMIIVGGCIILFIVGVLQERGVRIRETIGKLPLPVSTAIYFSLLTAIGLFGCTAAARGFIYAQF